MITIPNAVVGRTSPSREGLAPFRVDGLTPDAFGAGVGRALSGIGSSIATLSARMEAERQQQSLFNVRRDTISETLETQMWLQRKELEAPLGADGFTDEVNGFLEERHQRILEDMRNKGESQEAIDAMELSLLELRRSTVGTAANFQLASRNVRAATDLQGVGKNLSQIASLNPYEVDRALAAWDEAVASIPGIDAIQRERMRQEYLDAITLAAGYGLASQSPDVVVEYLSPMGFHNQLINAVIQQESTGNPNAISSKGAVGLMQVMPATAAEIASEIGDANFPWDGGAPAIQEYLSNPDINKRYGTHYLNKMLERYGGDVEAALVAYNGGPSRADAWLAAGKDDSVLPAETSAYYKSVTEKLTLSGGATPQVEFIDATQGKIRNLPAAQWVSDGVARAAYATDPNIAVKVTSAGQLPGQGIGSPRHDHGNAVDIVLVRNGREVTPAEDPELYATFLRNAAAAGFTGLGHYAWGVHVGGGSEAAWGPDKTKNSLDPRFAEAIAQGRAMRGGALPKELVAQGLTGNPILDKLTPAQRQSVLSHAQTELNRRQQEARAGLELNVANAEAAYLTTGEYAGVEPTMADFYAAYDPVTAEQKWAAFSNTRAVGQFIAGMKTMSAEEIANELNRITPTDTSSSTYAVDVRSFGQAQEAANTILKAREDDPAGYVIQHFPRVQQAFAHIAESDNPSMARAEAYYAMAEAYRQLGMRPSQMQPIPQSQLDVMREQFDMLTPEQQVQQLVGWRGEMGELYGNGLQQLADNGMVVEAYLSGLVAESPAHLSVAAGVLRGRKIIAEDPSRRPSTEQVHQAYRTTMGDTQRSLAPQVNGAVIEAATALYIANGGAPDNIIPSEFEGYVQQVLGGLPGTNDTGMQDLRGWFSPVPEKTILPPGIRKGEFEAWQDSLTTSDLTRLSPTTEPFYDGGIPATAEDIANEGVFVKVGPSQYIIKMNSDGNPLVDADGNYYRMILVPATIRGASIMVD